MGPQGNRLMDAVLLYTEQQVRYRIDNPIGSQNDMQAIQLKKQYYQDLVTRYKKRLTISEKATRKYLKNEIRKLKLNTKPGIVSILLYSRLSRWFRNFITGNLKTVDWHHTTVQQHQNMVGNEQNFARLNHMVKQSGFTQNIDHVLQKMIAQDLPRFHIRYADIRHPNTDFILHFSKIPGTGTYEFERFDAASRPAKNQQGEQQWQPFAVNADLSLSASEAAHLVNGRAVCKENNNWLVLDRTDWLNPVKNISFDLVTALKDLPLTEMNSIEYRNLLNSLKAGATKEVTLDINGDLQKYQLVASPLNQSIRTFDTNNRPVHIPSLVQQSQEQAEKVSKILNQSMDNTVDLGVDRGVRIR